MSRMDVVDQVFSEANQENPFLAILLGTLFDGGRIITTGSKAEELFNLVPDLLIFERRKLESLSEVSDLTVKDCLIVENASVDFLLSLARATGSQVIHLSERKTDDSLVDGEGSEQLLRSALLSLRTKLEKILPLKGQIHLEGPRLNKALFLDRDGVLIEDTHYVKNKDDVRILPEVTAGLKKARELGFQLIVVSNQSGLGRGIFDWSHYEQVSARMQELLAQENIYLDRLLRAPFYEKSIFASGLIRKSLRKPRPGMIHQVVSEFRIDLSQSVLVGDSARDLMAGALAGVGKLFLMHSARADEEFNTWTQWPLASRFIPLNNMKRINLLPEVFKELSAT